MSFLAATLLARNYGVPFVFHVSSISDTERWLPSRAGVYYRKTNQKCDLLYLVKRTVYKVQRFPHIVFNYYGFYLVDAVVCEKDDDMGKLPVKRQVKIYDSALSCYKPFKWDKPFIVWVASLKPIKNPEKFIALAEHFLNCIRTGAKSESSGLEGLKVVQVLEAATVSLKNSGGMVKIAKF